MEDFSKADLLLKDALRHALGSSTKLRAIVSLLPEAIQSTAVAEPAAFSSRAAWQKAKVAERKNLMASATGATRKALEQLELEVKGGGLGGPVVIEGTADQIANSLRLPGVAHATLDAELQVELGSPSTAPE